MQPCITHEWVSRSAEDTHNLGICLGQQARRGDYIVCCGPLGAGKTAFVQGFAQGLGVGPEAYVRSPTFTLMHEYTGRIPLYHFDFYRLTDVAELDNIGFDDYRHMLGVVIIEWGDKFLEVLPPVRLDLILRITTPESRSIQARVYDQSYLRYLHSAAQTSGV